MIVLTGIHNSSLILAGIGKLRWFRVCQCGSLFYNGSDREVGDQSGQVDGVDYEGLAILLGRCVT